MGISDSIKISSVDIYKYNIKLRAPFKIANNYYTHANNVLVRVNTSNGIYGFGEASPAPATTGDTQESAFKAAQFIAKSIKGKSPLEIETRTREMGTLIANEPQIKCAFDEAFYDILGKTAKMPLYRLLGGENRELTTGAAIGIQNSAKETLFVAKMLSKFGMKRIKLKTGLEWKQDVSAVRSVREELGSDTILTIDSNQGWDFPIALAALTAMEPYNVEFAEQPIPAKQYENLRELRKKTKIPICVDESVFTHFDAYTVISQQACDFINIKLGKSAGLHTGLKINAIAEANNIKCMIGCFHESRLSLSVSAHFAAARPNIAFLDLDSGYALAEDPIIGGMKYDTKKIDRIIVPNTPGHGADVKEDFLEDQEKITI